MRADAEGERLGQVRAGVDVPAHRRHVREREFTGAVGGVPVPGAGTEGRAQARPGGQASRVVPVPGVSARKAR